MYGLPQARNISNDELMKHLAKHGYHPTPLIPDLWKHNTHPINFTLIVDDFAIKYSNKVDAE